MTSWRFASPKRFRSMHRRGLSVITRRDRSRRVSREVRRSRPTSDDGRDARRHRSSRSGHRRRRADQSCRDQVEGIGPDHPDAGRGGIRREARPVAGANRSARREEPVRPGDGRRPRVVRVARESAARPRAKGFFVRASRHHRFRARQQPLDVFGGDLGHDQQEGEPRPGATKDGGRDRRGADQPERSSAVRSRTAC